MTCTADTLGLISGREQSETQRFVGIESQQQCHGPASKAAAGPEGERGAAEQCLLLSASRDLKYSYTWTEK